MVSSRGSGAGHNRRVRTPTLLQMEVTECGAASLGIVLAYHGRWEPLATLRQACGVSRDGSKASNIVKAARTYGLDARGYSKSVDALRSLPTPYIVFWNFNHFLVVEGFAKDRVYLNDPAMGHRVVSLDEFDRSFTGVVLTMRPDTSEQAPCPFEPGGARPGMLAAVRDRLDGLWPGLAYGVLAGFLLVIPGIAIPAFGQVFVDSIIIEEYTHWLQPLLLAMLVALLLQAALKYLQLKYLRRLYVTLAIRLASRFMWRLLRMPASFFAQRFAGEVASRTQNNDKLAHVLSGRLTQICIDVVMVAFYLALMLFYDSVLTFIAVGFALLNLGILRWVSNRRVEANMKLMQEYGKAQSTAMSALKGMETIKSSGQEPGFFTTWSGYYAKASNARQALELDNQALTVLPVALTAMMMALVLVVGGLRIIDGYLTIGMLVAFQLIMTRFMSPINNLMNLGATVQELRGDLERVDDVMRHPTLDDAAPAEAEDQTWPNRLKGYVSLQNLGFGFSPLQAPLIEDVTLEIRPGQCIALVGPSGSGKSTLIKLVSGEYQPWSGEVQYDGHALDRIPRELRVRSFAEVAQEVYLFEGSIRDNLTLWDDSVPEEAIIRACRDAAIHDTILERAGGYAAAVLEGGANFSGGQRQRMEIARALVHNPSILVMDEATAALDAETERLVMERLRMRGCTCIMVSHRLSAIRDCDAIYVMQQGRIVEQGDHASLSAANGAYTQLLREAGNLEQTPRHG